jgi:hypothetical protein
MGVFWGADLSSVLSCEIFGEWRKDGSRFCANAHISKSRYGGTRLGLDLGHLPIEPLRFSLQTG